MFSAKTLRVFTESPDTTFAQFLRVSDSFVSEYRRQAEAAQGEMPDRHFARRTIMAEANELRVREWNCRTTLSSDWSILQQAKEQILHRLELSNPDAVASKSYSTRFIQRVFGAEFLVRTVTSDQIETHFKVLEEAEIASMSPHFARYRQLVMCPCQGLSQSERPTTQMSPSATSQDDAR
jgi:hypothetical protein